MAADRKAEAVEHALRGENWCPAGLHWTTDAVSSSPYKTDCLCCFSCFRQICHMGAFPIVTIKKDSLP